jgi:hypothetical protein
MPECIYCGAETKLRVSGIPICGACSKDLDEGHKPPYQRDPTPSETENTEETVTRKMLR